MHVNPFRISFRPLLFLLCSLLGLLPRPSPAKPADLIPAAQLPTQFLRTVPGSRPARQAEYLSPQALFLIHYDTSGYHAVPADYTFHPEVPDYVFCTARYLEDSYHVLYDSLGFTLPPADSGSDPEIDVYFSKFSDIYGETYPEEQVDTQVWTSYIHINSDLEDALRFYTTGLPGLQVTCAHELFHVFQLGYRYRSSDYFYFEMSSVWFEEYMYPGVNDYHNYFTSYVVNWNYALNHANLYYKNVGFNLYLDSRYSQNGNNVIRAIWERILSVPALDAISAEVQNRGGSMAQALSEWGSAQVLCSPYAALNFPYAFEDAAELPGISFSRYPGNVIRKEEFGIKLSAAPMTGYYRIPDLPEQTLLLDFSFPEHMKVRLVALNGTQSRVYSLEQSPQILDGVVYREWILSVGATQSGDSGRVRIRILESDMITGIAPNPLASFRSAELQYILAEERDAGEFLLFDLRGRKVHGQSLPAALLSAGAHQLSLSGLPETLASGIYIAVLKLDGRKLVKKLTLIK